MKMSRTPKKVMEKVKDIISENKVQNYDERYKLNARNIRTLKEFHHNKCRSKTKNLSQGLAIKFSIVEGKNG